jgi:RNA polymerase sigma-70 factor (ECF subfamily)
MTGADEGVPPVPVHLHNEARESLGFLAYGIKGPVMRLRAPGSSRFTKAPPVPSVAAEGTADPPDDATLAAQARADAEAFGLLYDRYCEQIYRFVHRRLGSHEAAEDVTAEVFIKALRAIDSYMAEKAPFSSWLYRIATNAVIDHTRARRMTTSLDVAIETADPNPPVEEQAINLVDAAAIWKAVDALTVSQRNAVLLRFDQDLPIAVIAERMGRSEGAVKLLLNRGLAAVRAQLKPVAGQEDRS